MLSDGICSYLGIGSGAYSVTYYDFPLYETIFKIFWVNVCLYNTG